MDFYDELASHYHLLFPDWVGSSKRQAEQLDSVIQSQWPGSQKLLDISCGIGTQAIGLAGRGYRIVASDLSGKEVERARQEAARQNVSIEFKMGDMRAAHALHGSGFDVVISCDNSMPHLLTDDDLLLAFRQFLACLRPGSGCLVTVRDYEKEARGPNAVKHYGARIEGGKRYLPFQVWDFDGDYYDFTFFIVEEDLASGQVQTHAMRSRYYAVSVARLCELMQQAGFEDVKRLDGVFYQPVIVGTRPSAGVLALRIA